MPRWRAGATWTSRGTWRRASRWSEGARRGGFEESEPFCGARVPAVLAVGEGDLVFEICGEGLLGLRDDGVDEVVAVFLRGTVGDRDQGGEVGRGFGEGAEVGGDDAAAGGHGFRDGNAGCFDEGVGVGEKGGGFHVPGE